MDAFGLFLVVFILLALMAFGTHVTFRGTGRARPNTREDLLERSPVPNAFDDNQVN